MNANFIIRPGVPEDLDSLLDLDKQLIAFDSEFDPSLALDWSHTEEAHDFYLGRLKGDEGVVFVIEDSTSDQLLGYLCGAEAEPETYRQSFRLAEIECLYVSAECRGQRLGEQLTQQFSEWCKTVGIDKLSVTVSARNKRGRNFYEQLGFADYDVVLEKDL